MNERLWVKSTHKRDGQLGLGLGATTDMLYGAGEASESRLPNAQSTREVVYADGLGAMTDVNAVEVKTK